MFVLSTGSVQLHLIRKCCALTFTWSNTLNALICNNLKLSTIIVTIRFVGKRFMIWDKWLFSFLTYSLISIFIDDLSERVLLYALQRREFVKKTVLLSYRKMANLTIEIIANSLEESFKSNLHTVQYRKYINFHCGTHANTLITVTLNSNAVNSLSTFLTYAL